METTNYQNPIQRGFRPDPSICVVNRDFYLVNSTFEYFPGVPIFHSTDLIRWKQIGSCLTRESQLPLKGCRPSGGIYAPTLRFHNGTFYMITTNITSKGNFIVYTDTIDGEWSEPQWIDQVGIDPSLFFDDDGKAYFCGTGMDENGKQGIVLFEINPRTGEILSDKKIITYGMTAKYPEGPHIYKINGWYYLMVAEGGTEYGHMETIFRCKNIWGPYEACPGNPILSNQYDMYNPIQCCGHADMMQDPNGNWWVVCLGIRKLPNGALLHNLGRETFLAPVTWTESGWPKIGENGTITETMKGPLPLGAVPRASSDFADDFTSEKLAGEWMFLRNPDLSRFKTGNGKLWIHGGTETMSGFAPTFTGVRQTEFNMAAQVTVSSDFAQNDAMAGMTVHYSRENHYDFYLQKENGRLYAILSRRIMDLEAVTGKLLLEDTSGAVTLQIRMDTEKYTFEVVSKIGTTEVGSGCTAGVCTETTQTMTFTGAFIGLFARNTDAEFTNFSLTEV